MSEAPIDKLWELIEDVRIAMLTTRDGGLLRARPMGVSVDKAGHEFRFLTRLSSHKTDELTAYPDVNITFAKPSDDIYVSVSGQASLTQDRALIDALWNPYADAWFDCGKDDPDIAVIRVTPSQAEYWEGHSRPRQAWSLIRAKATGEAPDLGENEKLSL